MRALKIIFLLLAAISIFSCKKDKQDSEVPSITKTKPLSTDTIGFGEEAHIHADINDNIELKSFSLTLTVMPKDSVVSFTEGTIDGDSYHVHKHWVNNLTGNNEIWMTVYAIDESGNNTSAASSFYTRD